MSRTGEGVNQSPAHCLRCVADDREFNDVAAVLVHKVVERRGLDGVRFRLAASGNHKTIHQRPATSFGFQIQPRNGVG